MDRILKYHLDHVGFWIATIGFHMYTRRTLIDDIGVPEFLLEVLVRNSLLAIIIYVHLLILIPRFARQERWLPYALLLLADFAFYVAAKNAHDLYLARISSQDQLRTALFFDNTFYNFSIALFYMAFGVGMHLARDWFQQRELIRRIEIEGLNAEIKYLRAQINPHFLFNSINTIFFQIDKQNNVARTTLSAFSEMLRYQLYECNGNQIAVEKEVAYLKNYVDLQRQRKDKSYAISFSHDQLNGFDIAPLLLIPFVENAFKHVSNSSPSNQIKIELNRSGNFLKLVVFNTSEPRITSPPSDTFAENGIGLSNVKRRLELIYGDKHLLRIRERPDSFEVDLQIPIEHK